MSFLSRLFTPTVEFDAVYHIGTSSVGVGIVQLAKNKAPQILHSLREPIPYRESVTSERFVTDMLDTVKLANTRLLKESGHIKIRSVYYIFSSPWAVTQTKVVNITEKHPFVVSKGLIDKAISSEDSQASDKTLKLIEKKIIDIKLNGYHISDPYGKKATEAEVSLFTSFIPKALFDSVQDVARLTYHSKNTKAFSCALASFSAIRDIFHEDSDFMFLDIGGELSDLMIVKDGLVAETGSFPLGGHFLLRSLKNTLSISAEEATSLAHVYEDNTIEAAFAEQIGPVIEDAAKEWATHFRNAVRKIGNGVILPMKLFVVLHNDFHRFFEKALTASFIPISGENDVPVVVSFIDYNELTSSVSFSETADKDPFIGIVATFVGKLHESNTR